jgi:hypothetical protein
LSILATGLSLPKLVHRVIALRISSVVHTYYTTRPNARRGSISRSSWLASALYLFNNFHSPIKCHVEKTENINRTILVHITNQMARRKDQLNENRRLQEFYISRAAAE